MSELWSGQGLELVGVEHSAVGLVPAPERFHPDHLASAQAHLGLVVHSQVAVLDGAQVVAVLFRRGL